MNIYKAEATAVQADLDAASELEAQNHDLEQYISQVPDLLSKIDANDEIKEKVIAKLGVGVYMYPEGEHKQVDWALFGKSFPLTSNANLASHATWAQTGILNLEYCSAGR